MTTNHSSIILLVAAAVVGGALFFTAGANNKPVLPDNAVKESAAPAEHSNHQHSEATVMADEAVETSMASSASAENLKSAPVEGTLIAPTSKADMLKPRPGDHVLGDANAPLTVVEYASLSCSHCADFHTGTFPAFKEKYIDTGKVYFIYRHYPFNAPALAGAKVTECSGDDFFKYLKVLFKTQAKWAYTHDYESALKSLATVGGMSSGAFDACMKNQDVEDQLVKKMQWGSEKLGIQSTPSFMIGDNLVNGNRNITEFSQLIDAELAKKGAE